MEGLRSQYVGIAVIVTVLCMAAAFAGLLVLKLSDDGDSIDYRLSDKASGADGDVNCSGTLASKTYNESSLADILEFSLDASADGDVLKETYTIMIDKDSGKPVNGLTDAGTSDGCELWIDSSGSGTVTYWIDGSGSVQKLTVLHNGYTYTVERT
ncbi:MAG: hypothetical protein VZQ28_03335 [Methanomethylophilus sp.]|jgi:hypothetical protein|nr:hypothetical protein [Methanomethylophilus sp.]